MGRKRRIAALGLLRRIRQYEVDTISARLSAIREKQYKLQNDLANLSHIQDREGHANTPEAAAFLAGFLNAIQTRRRYLDERLSRQSVNAEAIEAELLEVFRQKKSLDFVLDQAEEKLRLEREAVSFSELEDTSRNRYLRDQMDEGMED